MAALCVVALCGATAPPLTPGGDASIRLATAEKGGRAAFAAGDYPNAERIFQATLNEVSRYSDASRTAGLAFELSRARFQLQKLPEALLVAKQARDMHSRLKYSHDLSDDLELIGRIEFALGDYKSALSAFEDSLLAGHSPLSSAQGVRKTPDPKTRPALEDLEIPNRSPDANEYRNIGAIELELGQVDEALQNFGDSIKIDGASYDGAAYTRELIGQAELARGRMAEALSAFETSLAGYRSLAAHQAWERREWLGTTGTSVTWVGCVGGLLRADGTPMPCSTPVPPANIYGDGFLLGELLDRSPVALARGQVRALSDIARVEIAETDHEQSHIQRMSHLDAARNALREGLSLDEAIDDRLGQADLLAELGLLEARAGQPSAAKIASDRAVNLTKDVTSPTALWKVSYALARTAALIDNEPITVQCPVGDNKVARSADVPRALPGFERAIGLIEQIRAGLQGNDRAGFFASKLGVYDDYVSYLLRLDQRFPGRGCDRKAFEIFERRTARATLDQIGHSVAQSFRDVDPSDVIAQDITAQNTVEREIEAVTQRLAILRSKPEPPLAPITALEQRLQEFSVRSEAIRARIKRRAPQYDELINPRPVDVASMERTLRPGELLLVYDVLNGGSVLWTIDATPRFRMIPLPGAVAITTALKKVTKHVNTLRRGVANHMKEGELVQAAADDLPAFTSASAELYRLLIPAGTIPRGTSIIVVPSGPLYELAWETLVTGHSAGGAPHYLLADHAISYSPSASLLALMRRSTRGRRPEPLLAFARPAVVANSGPPARDRSYAAQQARAIAASVGKSTKIVFGDLKGTEDEARAVQSRLHAPRDSVKTGEAASRDALRLLNRDRKLRNYRYILFATHAVLPGVVVGLDQPAIVLAHPERPGNFLTMGDVFGLYLDADFVALSACDTGTGPTIAGEGISGLTRAFLYDGTPAISVTLWEVWDAAAPEIVPQFFENMHAGRTSAVAMQRAKLRFLATKPRFQHPFFWAPGVIFGDGDANTSSKTH